MAGFQAIRRARQTRAQHPGACKLPLPPLLLSTLVSLLQSGALPAGEKPQQAFGYEQGGEKRPLIQGPGEDALGRHPTGAHQRL